jgi:ribonuclease PH
MPRRDGRAPDQLRPIKLTRGWAKNAEGSCLAEFGETKVLCTASVEHTVPGWLRNSDTGWVTAEYGMLPRSTNTRNSARLRATGPTGAPSKSSDSSGAVCAGAVNMRALGERSIVVDCDVLQADGGTRTAAITGAWVALMEAMCGLRAANLVRGHATAKQRRRPSRSALWASRNCSICYEKTLAPQLT